MLYLQVLIAQVAVNRNRGAFTRVDNVLAVLARSVLLSVLVSLCFLFPFGLKNLVVLF